MLPLPQDPAREGVNGRLRHLLIHGADAVQEPPRHLHMVGCLPPIHHVAHGGGKFTLQPAPELRRKPV